jgi:hypothetical protein
MERGMLHKDLLRNLSSREVKLWRALWSVALSSEVRSKFHCLWITAKIERSEPMTSRQFGLWSYYMASCGLLPGGTESSVPTSDGLLNFCSLFLPAKWSTASHVLKALRLAEF